MKVLLIKDVYKLGRAGDVKRVADGYGRNFLLPQGLAVLATPGAIKRTETIRTRAAEQRAIANKEMGGIAEILGRTMVAFPSKAGETGKLYGSITSQQIAEAIEKKTGIKLERRQIDVAPIRTLGEHKAHIRLTVDLNPEVKVIVHREGEAPAGLAKAEAPVEEAAGEEPVETFENSEAEEAQAE
jgi:large subunit ribosomal protein L9